MSAEEPVAVYPLYILLTPRVAVITLCTLMVLGGET